MHDPNDQKLGDIIKRLQAKKQLSYISSTKRGVQDLMINAEFQASNLFLQDFASILEKETALADRKSEDQIEDGPQRSITKKGQRGSRSCSISGVTKQRCNKPFLISTIQSKY